MTERLERRRSLALDEGPAAARGASTSSRSPAPASGRVDGGHHTAPPPAGGGARREASKRRRSPGPASTWRRRSATWWATASSGSPRTADPAGSRTATSSQRSRTSAMSWETSTTAQPPARRPVDPLEALPLERVVTDGEHLVDQEDVGVGVDDEREPEAQPHAGRVRRRAGQSRASAGSPLKATISSARVADLAPREAEQHPSDQQVLAAGEVAVEAGGEVDERRDPPPDGDPPAVGRITPATTCSSVVLPDPLPPMTPSICPVARTRSTSRSAQASALRRRQPRRLRVR